MSRRNFLTASVVLLLLLLVQFAPAPAQTDPYQGSSPGFSAPLGHAFDITPNDSTQLTTFTRAVWVGTGGDLKADLVGDGSGNGGTVTFSNIADGTLLAVRVAKVYATGTTATDLVGGY